MTRASGAWGRNRKHAKGNRESNHTYFGLVFEGTFQAGVAPLYELYILYTINDND